MSTPAHGPATGLDLAALDAITDAVESGAGLPEIVRAAARALDASLVLTDRAGAVLAVAARSPADERSLLDDARRGRVDRAAGGRRARGDAADARTGRGRRGAGQARDDPDRLRGRAPARARARLRAGARRGFLHALLDRDISGREDILGRAGELGIDLVEGASIVVARAHSLVPTEDGWRQRVLGVADRGARAVLPGRGRRARRACRRRGRRVVILLPGADDATAARAADAVLRELQSALPGHSFAIGRSRPAPDPVDLHRAGAEALLAANVVEGDADRPVLAFEESGAYRLLLSAMSEDPAELQRFYAETVEPLVAYDEQYETGLVQTVEAFLEADGNVAGTAQRLFTHRHTIRYRLERVKELSGLDVGSTDGREKLSLGLKAMRVLGIAHRGGPATEAGAGGGRVPRRG